MKNKYILFNIIYCFVLIFSLSRSIAFGFITYHSTNSPNELGFLASSLALGSFIGYYFVNIIKEKYNKSYSWFFYLAQIGFITTSIFLLIYLYISQLNNNYGNYLLWSLYSLIVGFLISVEIRVKNYMLNEHFEKVTFSSIVKYDFLILSLSKFFGFSTGFLINSVNLVYIFVIISIFTNILIYFYVKKIPRKDEKIITNQSVVEIDIIKKLNYKTTLLLAFFVNLLIMPIGSQAVTYAKQWGYDFYYYLIFSAIGGIFFNLLTGNRQLLKINKKYIASIIMLIISISLLIIDNKYLSLISMFFYGGAFFLFNSIAQTRMFNQSIINKKLTYNYFPIASFGYIAGCYIYGKLLSINLINTFIFLLVISIITFGYIYKKSKKEFN